MPPPPTQLNWPAVHKAQCSAAVHLRLKGDRLQSAFDSGTGYSLKLIAHVHDGIYKQLEECYEYHTAHNGEPISEEDQQAAITRAMHLMDRQAEACFGDTYNGQAGIKIEVMTGKVLVTPLGKSTTKIKQLNTTPPASKCR